MRIAIPGSPNDGKEVEVIREADGYDPRDDCFRPEFAEIRILDSGHVGGIDRRYLVDL
jgi:hypothetical protein